MARRVLGTMIVYGFPKARLDDELDLAEWIGASVLEILPLWNTLPDPSLLQAKVAGRGLAIHSAHGCWGGESIRAGRVDLGSLDPSTHRDSVDDLKRCVDWLETAGGAKLVVHPGGLSDSTDRDARGDALARGLLAVADHAEGTGVVVCVENMPPGVFPGSRTEDLARILHDLDHPRLALAIDTGHAHITTNAATETLAARGLLATTHVHDNDGRQDSHQPPGLGSIDWPAWFQSLDAIDYQGPIILECIRKIREDRSRYRPEILNPFVDRRAAPRS
ncbi:sugar phosphate isomerase/epimerase family protein [Paludisphaera borealis]|uniref:Endonuclease 4 n=1 Tax=Paludisphaera borealis TaxID=1387353 RepID=A0A1U7CLG7_9BACT|nr:sugar phosphate isomerase/epimerase family protein [Paludisphaera borealis]APW59769.1 endonuclease 4 [Paludisphaera borealis]